MIAISHLDHRSITIVAGAAAGAWLAWLEAVEQSLHRSVARATSYIREHVLPPLGRNVHFLDVAMRSAVTERSKTPESPTNSVGTLRSAALLALSRPPEPGLVSVVIPSYNRADIIGRAIESALRQTYNRIQVIVADDGSADDTRERVEAYGDRVTYVRQANAGVSAARNFGIRQARGEFIALLDSDDEWEPWKIQAQVAALHKFPDAGAVWSDMVAVDEAGTVVDERHLRRMYAAYQKVDVDATLPSVTTLADLSADAPVELAGSPVRKGDLYDAILLGNLIHTSTVFFRRSWIERTGGFDESFARAGEDYEFYVRLCSAGPVVLIDAPSTLYRVGAADQLTRPSMLLEIARNNLRAIEKWIPRSTSRAPLPAELMSRRWSEAFAWAAETELDAGNRWTAMQRILKSIAVRPGLDNRALMLVRCALPFWLAGAVSGARRRLFKSRERSTA